MKILGGSPSFLELTTGTPRKEHAMPLFICDRCKCIENTATSDFWLQARRGSTERLCIECRTGKVARPVPESSPRRPTGHLASEH